MKNPKQGDFFREFRGELMNVEVDYDNEVESNNTNDSIVGVISEEANEFNTVQKILAYSEAVHMVIGKKTALSTHL